MIRGAYAKHLVSSFYRCEVCEAELIRIAALGDHFRSFSSAQASSVPSGRGTYLQYKGSIITLTQTCTAGSSPRRSM